MISCHSCFIQLIMLPVSFVNLLTAVLSLDPVCPLKSRILGNRAMNLSSFSGVPSMMRDDLVQFRQRILFNQVFSESHLRVAPLMWILQIKRVSKCFKAWHFISQEFSESESHLRVVTVKDHLSWVNGYDKLLYFLSGLKPLVRD